MRVLLSAVAVLSLVPSAYAQLAVPTTDTGLTYGHVHLNVSDMELHKRLWVEHFNGVVVEKGPLTAIRLPNFLVALSGREPTGGSRGSVMDHFGFKVRNLARFLAKWRAAGYTVDSEFTGAEGLPNAYVTMPDAVRVELQEDHLADRLRQFEGRSPYRDVLHGRRTGAAPHPREPRGAHLDVGPPGADVHEVAGQRAQRARAAGHRRDHRGHAPG